MSISPVTSFSSAIFSGIDYSILHCTHSIIFTCLVDQTGVVQNIAKTTTPLLKDAFVFGAVNGTVEYASTNLKKKAKRDWTPEGYGLDKGVDALQFAIAIASRYAVAKLCNEYFGTKITNEFVHIYTASDFIMIPFSRGPMDATIQLAKAGFQTAICAKVLSIFMATPLFKNAFYFGAINLAVVSTITNHSLKIHVGVEDPRHLYILHVALGVISLTGTYYSAKTCNQYLKLQIPRNYIVLMVALALPIVPVTAFFRYIKYDIFGADFAQTMERVKASESDNVQSAIRQLTEIVENMDGLDRRTIMQRFREGNFGEALSNAGTLLGPQFRGVLGQIFTQWMQGNAIEDIVTNSLEVLGSNAEAIDPVLGAVRVAVGVNSNKAGADFILEEVLKDASQQTKDAFAMMDAGRDTTKFIVTKAVAIYVVGSKKGEDTPNFFSGPTREKVQALRTQIGETPVLAADYEAVLGHLDAAAAKEVDDEDFFAFQNEIEEIEENEGQKLALTTLQGIGSPELQTTFSRNCCRIAAQKLAEEVE
ncbi:hypothetical protein [Candidatus Neptunichlamydia sp. REUL1]|uniref:hypothetical protein n=1 Tax=Candidatus Neptunichlamydia sp. REUL1 TaxID=3064277 RepID=UPI00292E54EE|nr:hypothetical protein [Candidatus Neptunochlamydia sp. REUL1]